MGTINLSPSTNPAYATVLNPASSALKKAIAKLCAKDFLVFAKVELQMEVARHHKEWWDILKTGEDSVFMAPRDHGKSFALARAYPIYKAKYDPWVKEIYILGADQPSAVENLDKIKEMITTTPSLSMLLPESRSDGLNSRTEVRLMNGVIIRAKGYSSPLRGRHPQLIVLDDVLNEKNSLTKEGRERVKQYFFDVVMPMKDKGFPWMWEKGYQPQVVLIGTAQDREDLYHELLKNAGFKGIKQQAVIDFEKKMVLWPERYNYDSLMQIRAIRGALSFSKEYQNEPLTEESSLFPPSLFGSLVKDANRSYRKLYTGPNPVFLGADFSVPGSSDGDWTVIFVLEADLANNELIPLWYWRARPNDMQDQIRQIEYFCQAYNVTLGYIEDNMFQKLYSNHINNRTMLPISGNTVTATGKNSFQVGVLSFRPLFETGRIRLPYKTTEDQLMTDHLIKEFNGVTQRKGKVGNFTFHDDTIMAFWHALQASRAGTSFSYDV